MSAINIWTVVGFIAGFVAFPLTAAGIVWICEIGSAEEDRRRETAQRQFKIDQLRDLELRLGEQQDWIDRELGDVPQSSGRPEVVIWPLNLVMPVDQAGPSISV